MFYNLCTSKKYRSWGLAASNSPDLKLPKETDMMVSFLKETFENLQNQRYYPSRKGLVMQVSEVKVGK